MSSEGQEAPSLEQTLKRLETIVAVLEREDLDLERALAMFEEGVAHIRSAQKIISETELRVQRLLADREGPYLEDMAVERS
jgi:exodeoxyribonuclease VII small subunit